MSCSRTSKPRRHSFAKKTVFPHLFRNHHITWSQVQDPRCCLPRILSLSPAEQRSTEWKSKFTARYGWALGVLCLPSWSVEVQRGSQFAKTRRAIVAEWRLNGKVASFEQEIPRKRIGFILKTEIVIGEARRGQASSQKTKRRAFSWGITAENCLVTERRTD